MLFVAGEAPATATEDSKKAQSMRIEEKSNK
jgi:hypothetical protein